MLLSPHLTYVQVLLSSVEDTFKTSIDHVRVDIPLDMQFNVSPVDMIKLALHVDVDMGKPMPVGVLSKEMTLNQMADSLLNAKGMCSTREKGCLAQ